MTLITASFQTWVLHPSVFSARLSI